MMKQRRVDLHSLGVRLTLGVALVSAMGMGSVALWLGARTQQILIATQKQSIEDIGDRFPGDVKIYSQMMSVEKALQKAVDNLTTGDTLLWVETVNGEAIAKSEALKMGTGEMALMSLPAIPPFPEIKVLKGRYWVVCGTPLVANGRRLGKIFLAQEITSEQVMLNRLLWSLGGASLLAIGLMTVAIAWYVKRELSPLQRLSQMTEQISPERFNEARIQLDRAPAEVKQLAQTLDRMLVRLHEAWELQRQFVSNVSHELRTPLTIVSGYLQSLLRRGTNLNDAQREALNIAATEAERTIQLFEDLLDLARVDSGHLPFHLEPVQLEVVAKEVVKMAQLHSDRAIAIEVKEPVVAIADLNRLKQVLLNLVDNAVKYSEPERPIAVILDRANQQAILRVRDRGPGIPLIHQTRIFERFYRADSARSRSTGGTGLGLSIVKTFVEGMHGHVSVLSKPGEGSVFTVVLPLARSETAVKILW
ncbi:MAG: HAMP domain-containing sensor histidine kinase [Cyanobacteriota bacterium]|nr:HAMP domain-containing sensor histidine kinase [Cyanobacteriota bacterium]